MHVAESADWSVHELVLGAAIVSNGLLAGLFFAFACAITLGLRRVDDQSYGAVFCAINAAILNPWFLLVFFAAPLTAVAAAVLELARQRPDPAWTLAGGVCSVLTFVITAAANVRLNRALELAPTDTAAERRVVRQRFEAPWNRWNLVRTATSVAALTALVVAAAG